MISGGRELEMLIAGAVESACRLSVGAVIVSFHADIEVLRRLLVALVPQVNFVCIVDNGSSDALILGIKKIVEKSNVELISLPGNFGIAVAQNYGINRVSELGFRYVALFDQDSVPACNMIQQLVDAHMALASTGMRVAAVGPLSVDQRTGTLGKFVRIGFGRVNQVACTGATDVVALDFLISSGSLIPVSVIQAIGQMNEAYFIDHVDTEWCLRARMANWQIFGVCSARLTHSLGDEVMRVWFGRWREVSVHSPLRNYYMIRNTVLMLRQSPMTWGWRIAHLVRMLQFFVFLPLAVPPRGRRVSMMIKGVWHGIIGRTGAY